jgi:diguanylate cyclase (GGDEF)-like protein
MNPSLSSKDVAHTSCLLPAKEHQSVSISAFKTRIWWWWGLALTIVTLLCVLLGLSYQQARSQAAADVSNLNRMLGTRLNGILEVVHTGLEGMASRMDKDMMQIGLKPHSERWQLRSLIRQYPSIDQFEVLTADGRFLFNSAGQPDTETTEARDFRDALARQGDDDGSSTPVTLDCDDARQFLHMAVPIVDGQHRLGWLIANIPLRTIMEIISEVDVGAHGVITLRQAGFPGVILRFPPETIKRHRYNGDAIDDLIVKGQQFGTLVAQSRVDGVERLYGFKKVGNFPLVLVTGLAAQDYLLSWKYTAFAAFAVCGTLYILIIGLTFTLQANRFRGQQMFDELRHSALHDDLTGLPNRRFLRRRVNEAINNCGLSQRLALLYFDLDNLKNINDSLGHLAGDTILQRLSHRLMALKPSVDTVARLSGDEFLVLVENDDPEHLAQLVASMLQIVQQPLDINGQLLSISASVGISLYSESSCDFGSLLKAADMALSQAKRNGRNTWVFYEAAMGARELRNHYIQTELRKACSNRDLEIHYQPQIDLRTGGVVGAEALLRWRHSEEGMIPPSEFIPIAESSRLILPISQWLLTEVCHQAVTWQGLGYGELSVAMNCSAVQFRQGNMVGDVRNALFESGLRASLLELELTESTLIENSDRVMDTIQGLRALGVRMSIDDFGTGYSSMAYLKRFAVDKLKIDQSFVRGMLSNLHDAAIINATIALGHSFGMKVIAEGVEEVGALDALIMKGCDQAQGYIYSQALSPSAFALFMQARIESAFVAEPWV